MSQFAHHLGLGVIDILTKTEEHQAHQDLQGSASQSHPQSKPQSIRSPNLCIFLSGNLGVGKTELCRQLLKSLGYQGEVVSPTYSIVQEYQIKLPNEYQGIYKDTHKDGHQTKHQSEFQTEHLSKHQSKPKGMHESAAQSSCSFSFCHIDAYRIKDPHELLAIGIEEYLANASCTLIEWGEKCGDLIKPDLSINIALPKIHPKQTSTQANPQQRIITLTSSATPLSKRLLTHLHLTYPYS